MPRHPLHSIVYILEFQILRLFLGSLASWLHCAMVATCIMWSRPFIAYFSAAVMYSRPFTSGKSRVRLIKTLFVTLADSFGCTERLFLDYLGGYLVKIIKQEFTNHKKWFN